MLNYKALFWNYWLPVLLINWQCLIYSFLFLFRVFRIKWYAAFMLILTVDTVQLAVTLWV